MKKTEEKQSLSDAYYDKATHEQYLKEVEESYKPVPKWAETLMAMFAGALLWQIISTYI